MLRPWILVAVSLAAGVAAPARGQAAGEDDAVISTRYLLRQAETGAGAGAGGGGAAGVEADAMLTGLRHLRRESLRPMFARWAESDRAALRLHGLLGLAELDEAAGKGGLDLGAVAELPEGWMQAEVVTAALDEGLLDVPRLERLLAWEGLDGRVKLIVAAELMRRGGDPPREGLRASLRSRNPGRRALAALLLHQLGGSDEGAAGEVLAELADAAGSQRGGGEAGVVAAMLLEAALRHDLTRAGPWALSLAADDEADPRVRLLGLRVAMRFGQRGAYELWRREYEGGGAVERLRLAMTALHLAPWVEASLFQPIEEADERVLAMTGRTGAAVAARGSDAAERAVELVGTGLAEASSWAVAWAGDPQRASGEDAALVLLAVLREGAGRADERGGDAGWLERSASAAQALHERGAGGAGGAGDGVGGEGGAARLRPMLADPRVAGVFKQAVLLGLLRSRVQGASAAVEGPVEGGGDAMIELGDPRAEMLAALLKARDGGAMTDSQWRDVREMARGGGDPGPALRMQAGWLYLERIQVSSRQVPSR